MTKNVSNEAWIYWTFNRAANSDPVHMGAACGLHPEVVKYIVSKGTRNAEGKFIDSQGNEYKGQEIN